MSTPILKSPGESARHVSDCRGVTLVEVLVAALLLAMTLLTICAMFITAYANVAQAGRSTLGLATARQFLEDVRTLPFDNVAALDGFDTDDPATLPADDPEREIARRWRFALAGEGVGWSFTDEEKVRWTSLADQGDAFGGRGVVRVVATSPTLTEITVTVSVPGRWQNIRFSTLLTRI